MKSGLRHGLSPVVRLPACTESNCGQVAIICLWTRRLIICCWRLHINESYDAFSEIATCQEKSGLLYSFWYCATWPKAEWPCNANPGNWSKVSSLKSGKNHIKALCIKSGGIEEIQGIDHKKAVGFLRDQGLFVDSWIHNVSSLGREQGHSGHQTWALSLKVERSTNLQAFETIVMLKNWAK
jgi:hypothetical protein